MNIQKEFMTLKIQTKKRWAGGIVLPFIFLGVMTCGEKTMHVVDDEFQRPIKVEKSALANKQEAYVPFIFGMCADEISGRIFVASFIDNKIYVLDSSLTIVDSIGSTGQGVGDLLSPAFVTMHNGNLYVVEWGNNRISVFSREGRFVKTITAVVNFRGTNIALDSKNRIYFLSGAWSDSLVSVIDNDGNHIFSFGERGGSAGLTDWKSNVGMVVVDSSDNIFVAYSARYAVRKYSSNFNLEWETDYSEFPPFAQQLKKNSDIIKQGIVKSQQIAYIANDFGFYGDKLYVQYIGGGLNGTGIYEIDSASGQLKRVFLLQHSEKDRSDYKILNFCFVENMKFAIGVRNKGEILLGQLQDNVDMPATQR